MIIVNTTMIDFSFPLILIDLLLYSFDESVAGFKHKQVCLLKSLIWSKLKPGLSIPEIKQIIMPRSCISSGTEINEQVEVSKGILRNA